MSDNNVSDVPEIIVKNKMMQQTVNGISHFLILWVIKNNGPIHGYELMNLLNTVFIDLIEMGSIRKSSPSRVYPMLKNMEESDLILGTWQVHDNKKIKFYHITETGEELLYFLRDYYIKITKTTYGNLFFNEFLKDE